jgi:hypothetical protein
MGERGVGIDARCPLAAQHVAAGTVVRVPVKGGTLPDTLLERPRGLPPDPGGVEECLGGALGGSSIISIVRCNGDPFTRDPIFTFQVHGVCPHDSRGAYERGSGRGSKAIRARAIAWLRAGDERIRSLQLRLDRGALARRRRRKLRAQLVPFLSAVLTSVDFGGMQTSTHDHEPPSGIVTAAGGIGRRTRDTPGPGATIRRHPKGRSLGCRSARFTSAR